MTAARLTLLAAALLFSTGGTVIKATSWSGFAVACGRSGVAALVLLALVPRWRRFWQPRALLVGAAYATTMVLFVVANKLTTAANAIFLQSTAPLSVLVIAPWLLGERNRRSDVALTAWIAVGLGLFFVGAEPARTTAPDPWLGNLVATSAGVSWAFTLVGLRWLAREAAPDGAASARDLAGASVVAGNGIAFAVSLPFAAAGPFPSLAVADVAAVAWLGVFQMGLAYVLLTRAVARLHALEASLLLLLEPVLGSLLAWRIHGEQPGPWSLAGCAVIGAATVLRTALGARRTREP